MSRERVLHIGKFYPPVRGGMESHIECVCNLLSADWDISVIVANLESITRREQIGDVRIVRCGTAFSVAGAPICPEMIGVIRDWEPSLVHLHVPNPFAVVALIASGYRGPIVISYHSDVVRQRVLNIGFQPVMNYVLRRSSAIIVTSAAYAEFSPVLRRCSGRCRVVPYGIDVKPDVDRYMEASRSVRRRFPGYIVLGVGRLVSYKGFEYLISAMRSVKAQLLLVGEGPLRGDLARLAIAAGVGDRVHFLGNVDNVAPYYLAADIFVLPSITPNEAFGIVQLEAMAHGLPVINTQLPSTVPFVSLHNITGITVPPKDSAALATAIELLLEREDLRTRFGKAGRKRVEEEFSLSGMSTRISEVYREALGVTVPRYSEHGRRATAAQ